MLEADGSWGKLRCADLSVRCGPKVSDRPDRGASFDRLGTVVLSAPLSRSFVRFSRTTDAELTVPRIPALDSAGSGFCERSVRLRDGSAFSAVVAAFAECLGTLAETRSIPMESIPSVCKGV